MLLTAGSDPTTPAQGAPSILALKESCMSLSIFLHQGARLGRSHSWHVLWLVPWFAALMASTACAGQNDTLLTPSGRDLAQQRLSASPRFSVIAHQGASGSFPGNTLESFEAAIVAGVDYIEADLVMTADGELIAMHGLTLDRYTDVRSHPEFSARRRTQLVGKKELTGFFVADFTLAEIRRLRTVQFFPQRSQRHNGSFKIPTFDEIVALIKRHRSNGNTRIQFMPELIAPAWHEASGLEISEKFLYSLKKANWTLPSDPIMVQCFDARTLRKLRSQINIRQLYLVPSTPESFHRVPEAFRAESLSQIASYVDALGIWIGHLLADDIYPLPSVEQPNIIQMAAARQMTVYAWTMCEPWCRAVQKNASTEEVLNALRSQGVHGVFGDFPDELVAYRETHK